MTLPEHPVRARQIKIGLILGTLTSLSVAVGALLGSPPVHARAFIALACVVILNAAVAYVGWPTADGFLLQERRKRGGRGSGPAARGLTGDAGQASDAAGRELLMRAVSRLMPAAAGRRWLAEAHSVLFETASARRAKAVRSYLRSAPRLAVLMWISALGRGRRRHRRRPR